MNGTWKKKVVDAAETLNADDMSTIMEFINDGSVNSKNYKKALARIDELKESYITNGS